MLAITGLCISDEGEALIVDDPAGENVIKIGRKVVRHRHYVTLQLAEAAIASVVR